MTFVFGNFGVCGFWGYFPYMAILDLCCQAFGGHFSGNEITEILFALVKMTN